MTLTELMVVVVILGILAAASRPMFSRDRVQREGQEFAGQLARDFQRARFTAIAERRPIRAFVFSDRTELRLAVAAADVNDPPRAAVLTDPIERVTAARTGITVWDVKITAGAPSAAVLNTATPKIIEWSSIGQAVVVGSSATLISVYVRNANTGVTPAERSFRIDVSPLTGHVSVAEAW
jgi:prepilin-type N-terminal cleavage/methylation domain-containing protein